MPTLLAECEFKRLKDVLMQHCKPKPLIIAEHFGLHKQDQRPKEKVNSFFIELSKLVQLSDLVDFLEQALRNIFICGLANLNLQKCLLTENMTLEWAVSIAIAMEMVMLEPYKSNKTAGASSYIEDEEINCIEGWRYVGHYHCCGKKDHMASQCHFHAYICYKCNKVGHLQAVCPEDKNAWGEKQKSERQCNYRSSKSVQQL